MQLLRGRTRRIDSLSVSSDGRYLVAGLDTCHVWHLYEPNPKPRPIVIRETGRWLRCVQFLTQTELFIETTLRQFWCRHDIETGVTTDLMRPTGLSQGVTSAYASGSLVKVFTYRYGNPHELTSYRVLNDRAELLVTEKPPPLIEGLFGYSPSGENYLVQVDPTSDPACKHYLLDTVTDAVVTTFERPPGTLLVGFGAWCFSPNGRQLFVAVARKLMRYDCATGGLPAVMVTLPERAAGGNSRIAVHPDGRLLATVEDGRAVTFRDADTLEVVRSYDFAMPTVTCVAFTPDGTRCVIGNSRGKVLLFDVE